VAPFSAHICRTKTCGALTGAQSIGREKAVIQNRKILKKPTGSLRLGSDGFLFFWMTATFSVDVSVHFPEIYNSYEWHCDILDDLFAAAFENWR
jgi:hypothetical protein